MAKIGVVLTFHLLAHFENKKNINESLWKIYGIFASTVFP